MLFIACKSISMAVHAFLVYFYTVLVIEQNKIQHQECTKIRHFDPKISKKFLRRDTAFSPNPSPCGEGVSPSTHPTPLVPSAPRLGSRLPPTSTPGFAYALL